MHLLVSKQHMIIYSKCMYTVLYKPKETLISLYWHDCYGLLVLEYVIMINGHKLLLSAEYHVFQWLVQSNHTSGNLLENQNFHK